MKPESIFFTVAGMCFGVIVGWILASTDLSRQTPAAPVAQAAPTQKQEGPPPLDEARVQSLTIILKNDPKNSGAAAQLGSTYLEAEQFDQAVKWYLEALKLDPKNVDASTQLGMTYFFTQGADPALAQLEKSLAINPNHPRTLLNKGVVLWRGKQDLAGAAEVWRKLVSVAPNSPEAQAAQQGLQQIDGPDAPAPPTNQ